MEKKDFRILCADDSISIRTYLTQILTEWGYDVTACVSGKDAWDTYQKDSSYSVVLLDWIMPEMTGIEACRKIRQFSTNKYTYIIMLTSKDSTENIVEALNTGADDYLTKPFHPAELKARIQTAYRFFEYERIQRSIENDTRLACYNALTELAEARDFETGQHLHRVSSLSMILAKKLGKDEDFQRQIGIFAPMHDIGKVGIPDNILLLPRRLTPEEFNVIKTHTIIGYQILQGKPTMDMAAEIAHHHHEKWDGSGYPDGLKGEEISLASRIVSVVDVYDALRALRPYKRAFSHTEALDIITQDTGKAFDPNVVEAFMTVEHHIKSQFDSSYRNDAQSVKRNFN